MVTFNNAGRLGNYLYEFACAWAYAKKNDLKFTVPLNDSNPKWCPVYFKELRDYSYNNNEIIGGKVIHWENGHHYQPLDFFEEWRDYNIVIEGYRQSYKYWDEYREELLKAFNFPYEMNKGVCAVHIRRTDYLQNPTKHPVVTLEYLSMALAIMSNQYGIYRFDVFSDDIAWSKEAFQYLNDFYQVSFSEGRNEIEDLILMSNCEHIICANSTMSTWASEINQNPNKIVIVPHQDNWFGDDNKKLEVYDMYRPEWVTIKY